MMIVIFLLDFTYFLNFDFFYLLLLYSETSKFEHLKDS